MPHHSYRIKIYANYCAGCARRRARMQNVCVFTFGASNNAIIYFGFIVNKTQYYANSMQNQNFWLFSNSTDLIFIFIFNRFNSRYFQVLHHNNTKNKKNQKRNFLKFLNR